MEHSSQLNWHYWFCKACFHCKSLKTSSLILFGEKKNLVLAEGKWVWTWKHIKDTDWITSCSWNNVHCDICAFPPRCICVILYSIFCGKEWGRGVTSALFTPVFAGSLGWCLHTQVSSELTSIKQYPGLWGWTVFVAITRLSHMHAHSDSWCAAWSACDSYGGTCSANNFSKISRAFLHCLNIKHSLRLLLPSMYILPLSLIIV